MARGAKRKKDFNRETDKIRNFELVLYPDTTSYNYEEVLQLLQQRFDKWAYITHDRDTDSNGEVKKAHTHFYGSRPGSVHIRNIANMSGVPENHINPVFDWDSAMKYAIHADDPTKFLYAPSDIKANFELTKHFKDSRDDAADAAMIFDYICETRCMTKHQLVRWVLDNGYWAAYRRAASTWSDLLFENRQRLYAQYSVNQDLNTDAVQAANRVIFSPVDDSDSNPFEQMSL